MQITAPDGRVTTFAYNAISQKTGETGPLGDPVAYTFNAQGRKSVSDI